MTWVALHLPRLSLEAFMATTGPTVAGRPVVLLDGATVVGADATALARGIRPGLRRATALALAADLVAGHADPVRDRRALAAVVHAALAFSPTVTVQPWPDDRDATASDDTPPTVLLDVSTTLAYWGGRDQPPARQRDRLLQRLQAALSTLGHALQVATAPTPGGAAVLARRARLVATTPADPRAPLLRQPAAADLIEAAAGALHAPDRVALGRALDASPVWLVGPGRSHWDALQGMGLRTLGDLRALPRSGVARRFGEALLDTLDRAYGDRPDPRPLARLPPRFDSTVELFARAETVDALRPGAEVLFHRLAAWLRAQQARTRRCCFVLQHERGRWAASVDQVGTAAAAETRLELVLAEPTDDAMHLLALLVERLGRMPLPAPTLDLALHCDDRVQASPPDGELFPSAARQREGFARLIERLQARLGPTGVQRPVIIDDHRPEVANALAPLAGGGTGGVGGVGCGGSGPGRSPAPSGDTPAAGRAPAGSGPARPIWLVHPPRPLRDDPSGPRLGPLPLQLLSGPERLETGWWGTPAGGDDDAALVERDYFIAQTPDGALLWLYRLRRAPDDAAPAPPGWFLHGRFG